MARDEATATSSGESNPRKLQGAIQKQRTQIVELETEIERLRDVVRSWESRGGELNDRFIHAEQQLLAALQEGHRLRARAEAAERELTQRGEIVVTPAGLADLLTRLRALEARASEDRALVERVAEEVARHSAIFSSLGVLIRDERDPLE